MLIIRRVQLFYFKNQDVVLLGGVFILIHLFLYYRTGIFTSLEATKYIEQGERLSMGYELSELKYFFYLPVILLVSFCKTFHLPLGTVVLVQIALSAWSQYCFYRLTRSFSDNRWCAFFTSLGLLLFIPYQSWNFYLYSESIFLSLCLMFTWLVYKNRLQTWPAQLSCLLLLGILVLSRPTGILFIFPWLLYLLLRKQAAGMRFFHLIMSIIILIVASLLINQLYAGGNDFDSLLPFVEEHIICGVPSKESHTILDLVKDRGAVGNLLYYILHNPLHFLKLFSLRLISFFNMTRHYYSTAHNLLLVLFMIPVYLFGIIGWVKKIKPGNAYSIFLIALFITYPSIIALQCDDWHSRFTMVLIPHCLMLASLGVLYLSDFRRNRFAR
ncbi:MAG: hypothetical protein BGO54_04925 [Sphingobacteriales bacterium 46-32]|jgi:hypothetical protein|nr:MAG: hypothetical protein BGO54_04925 [Sphingobacteriales bacterium 46-32]